MPVWAEIAYNGFCHIPTDAFQLCNQLKTLTIEEGVTNIGLRAFADCSSLTSATIPTSVTSRG